MLTCGVNYHNACERLEFLDACAPLQAWTSARAHIHTCHTYTRMREHAHTFTTKTHMLKHIGISNSVSQACKPHAAHVSDLQLSNPAAKAIYCQFVLCVFCLSSSALFMQQTFHCLNLPKMKTSQASPNRLLGYGNPPVHDRSRHETGICAVKVAERKE